MSNPNTSRRCFLGRAALSLGLAAAATTVAVAAAPKVKEAAESLATFETPDQYIAAMKLAGWRAVAGFHFKRDGSVHPMGVYEYGPEGYGTTMDPAEEDRVRSKFHLIAMRSPQTSEWSQALWTRLWQLDMRENILPRKYEPV